jgi:hypothetical protein
MALYDYQGSLAQKYIQFVTSIVLTTVPGQNYYAALIFIDSADAAANFVAAPAVDTITSVTAQNYTSLLTGSMLSWMTGFYSIPANQVSTVYFVSFTSGSFSGSGSTSADLGSQFATFDQYAYFKLIYSSAYKKAANLQLATLCVGDPLSQFLFGSNDGTFLTGAAGTEAGWFKTAGLDVPFIYHWDSRYNPALVQLGATLAIANSSATPVGNKLDWLAIANFTPSGSSVAGIANLTAIQYGYAQASGICFFTYVGDGSGNVAAEKWLSTVALTIKWQAQWLVNFVDTVASINVTTFLTATPQSGFKNNDTYQGCLNLLQVQLNKFVGMGRLSNVKITAPPFNQLPAASQGAITVPNAWSATYADNTRSVTVYGTLTIAA